MGLTFKNFEATREPTEDQVLFVLQDTQLELSLAEIAMRLVPYCGTVNETCLAERLRSLHSSGQIKRRPKQQRFSAAREHIAREW